MDESKQSLKVTMVDIMVGGEIMDKKLVVPEKVNFNAQSRRLNIHLNSRDVISLTSDRLEKWGNVKLEHSPGGKVEEAVEIKPTGSVEMRLIGENDEKRFLGAKGIKFDRNRDSLSINLPENHRIEIPQSRFKSLGLKIEPDLKARTVER